MSIILILTKKEQLNRYFLALPLLLYLVCNRIKKSLRSRSISRRLLGKSACNVWQFPDFLTF